MIFIPNQNSNKWAVTVFFLKLFFYYILLFTFFRLLFICRLLFYFPNLSFNKAIVACFYAFHLDVAMLCYLTILPLMCYFIFVISQKSIFYKSTKKLTLFFSVIYAMVAMGDLLLYPSWKTKLNMQAVLHFTNPTEVLKTASILDSFVFFIGIPIIIYFFSKLYNLLLKNSIFFNNLKSNIIALIPAICFITVFFRGGIQELPISESKAYYSNINEYNDASVNPLFSFINSASAYFLHSNENPFVFFKNEEALTIVETNFMNSKNEDVESFLTKDKPNIIYIILESFSAQCSKYFNGLNLAPNLDSIAKTGIAFTHCYSSGNVSDQGIPAILSSFPASPSASLINQISKSKTLPCVVNELKPKGYNTGFLYGGQLSFGNIKSYIMQQQFDNVKDENELPTNFNKQALGINDMDMGGVLINELNYTKEPFMYGWFTLSTHNNFDIPVPKIHMANTENEYVNALHYTDSCLGLFFEKAKKQTWYKNTLFVLVSDHSHNTPVNSNFQDIDRYRIPLVFVGDVIKPEMRGKKINYTVSQLDITATILKQVQQNESLSKYIWSKNLFTKQAHFAPYCYFKGAGFIQDSTYCLYNINHSNMPEATNVLQTDTNFIKTTKAFIQAAYEEYRKR